MAISDSDTEEKRKFLAKNKPPALTLDNAFNVEWLRLFGMGALMTMFIVARVFSNEFVFFPDETNDGSGSDLRGLLRGDEDSEVRERRLFTLFGHEHPYVHVEDTVIYKTFGMTHTCSYIDLNPAKEASAIVLPLFSFTMSLFLILAHFRNKLVQLNNPNDSYSQWLYNFSKVSTPFSVFGIQMSHLWFVNDPEEAYPKGFWFPGHYIPYVLFQIVMALTAIMQVHYQMAIRKIPFNVSVTVARWYVRFFVLLTVVYQILIIAIVVGKPIVDSKNGGWEEAVIRYLSRVYAVCVFLVPCACSYWSIKNSSENRFTMALQ